MKQHRREINIFSISALDLFASALGAFILIAVVFMPYFPNTGDSEERVSVMRDERDAAAERAEKLQTELDKLKGSTKLPPVDVIIAVDTTRSMEYAVNGLKADIKIFASILSGLSDSASLGVIDFKDRCEGARTIRKYDLRLIDATSKAQLQQFVNGMQARNYQTFNSCNTEQPEAVDMALRAATAQEWREESVKQIIVIVTDNPAEDRYIQQTYSDARRFSSAKKGRSVSTVFTRSEGSLTNAVPYLRELARSGDGAFIPAGGSFIGNVLLAILDE